MKFTNEEKLIKFLICKLPNSSNNKVSINRHEIDDIGLSEKEIIQSVYLLEKDGLIDITRKSIHDDLSVTCTVALGTDCVHYFESKRANRNLKIREWVWWGVTTVISIIALIVSLAQHI